MRRSQKATGQPSKDQSYKFRCMQYMNFVLSQIMNTDKRFKIHTSHIQYLLRNNLNDLTIQDIQKIKRMLQEGQNMKAQSQQTGQFINYSLLQKKKYSHVDTYLHQEKYPQQILIDFSCNTINEVQEIKNHQRLQKLNSYRFRRQIEQQGFQNIKIVIQKQNKQQVEQQKKQQPQEHHAEQVNKFDQKLQIQIDNKIKYLVNQNIPPNSYQQNIVNPKEQINKVQENQISFVQIKKTKKKKILKNLGLQKQNQKQKSIQQIQVQKKQIPILKGNEQIISFNNDNIQVIQVIQVQNIQQLIDQQPKKRKYIRKTPYQRKPKKTDQQKFSNPQQNKKKIQNDKDLKNLKQHLYNSQIQAQILLKKTQMAKEQGLAKDQIKIKQKIRTRINKKKLKTQSFKQTDLPYPNLLSVRNDLIKDIQQLGLICSKENKNKISLDQSNNQHNQSIKQHSQSIKQHSQSIKQHSQFIKQQSQDNQSINQQNQKINQQNQQINQQNQQINQQNQQINQPNYGIVQVRQSIEISQDKKGPKSQKSINLSKKDLKKQSSQQYKPQQQQLIQAQQSIQPNEQYQLIKQSNSQIIQKKQKSKKKVSKSQKQQNSKQDPMILVHHSQNASIKQKRKNTKLTPQSKLERQRIRLQKDKIREQVKRQRERKKLIKEMEKLKKQCKKEKKDIQFQMHVDNLKKQQQLDDLRLEKIIIQPKKTEESPYQFIIQKKHQDNSINTTKQDYKYHQFSFSSFDKDKPLQPIDQKKSQADIVDELFEVGFTKFQPQKLFKRDYPKYSQKEIDQIPNKKVKKICSSSNIYQNSINGGSQKQTYKIQVFSNQEVLSSQNNNVQKGNIQIQNDDSSLSAQDDEIQQEK